MLAAHIDVSGAPARVVLLPSVPAFIAMHAATRLLAAGLALLNSGLSLMAKVDGAQRR